MFNRRNRRVAVGIVALVLAGAADRTWGAESNGAIAGVVKTASGEAAIGALVRVKHGERGVSFTVVSQEQGRYHAGNLPPGEYTVQATGGGFQNDSKATVQVSGSETARMNLALGRRQSVTEMAATSDLAKLFPEAEIKAYIMEECTSCHIGGLEHIASSRKSQEEWLATVEKMRNHPYGNIRSLNITDQQRDKVVDYLAKHFGPDRPPLDPDRDLPKAWFTGESSKFMVTEYDLPRGAAPHDVAVDSKGIGWVGEDGHGVIGRFDPQTLTYTRIPIPPAVSKPTAHTITVGPQDQVWVPDSANNRLVQYDPKTQQFTMYPAPKPPGRGNFSANTIAFHPDGTMWMTQEGSNTVAHLEPKTKQFTYYPVPSGVRANKTVAPYGIAIDGNGWIWFAEHDASKIGQVDSKTGEITERDTPTPNSRPKRMGTDGNGNVWFGEWGSVGKLGIIDYRTSQITEYPTPTQYSGLYSVGIDRMRNHIWASEFFAAKLARFDPRTNRFTEYPLFNRITQLRKIAVDPSRPGRVWYGGYRVDTVGYLDVIE